MMIILRKHQFFFFMRGRLLLSLTPYHRTKELRLSFIKIYPVLKAKTKVEIIHQMLSMYWKFSDEYLILSDMGTQLSTVIVKELWKVVVLVFDVMISYLNAILTASSPKHVIYSIQQYFVRTQPRQFGAQSDNLLFFWKNLDVQTSLHASQLILK